VLVVTGIGAGHRGHQRGARERSPRWRFHRAILSFNLSSYQCGQ
jgi:hypothetical protein